MMRTSIPRDFERQDVVRDDCKCECDLEVNQVFARWNKEMVLAHEVKSAPRK